MIAALRHRGPDDFGYLFANAVAGRALLTKNLASPFRSDVLLGCRRLAITDLGPSGSQPMGNEDGTVFVVHNGAIHNFVELRGELEALGHRFRSHSDTEVIVHAYEQWGEDCARRFNGMWAYVIWDGRRRRLVCSRDRFGIKPLMIARVRRRLLLRVGGQGDPGGGRTARNTQSGGPQPLSRDNLSL